jgi:hypothetical protein
MIKPLSIFLCVLVTAAIAGCSSRHGKDIGSNDERSRETPKPGAPHALAAPVAALGIRG